MSMSRLKSIVWLWRGGFVNPLLASSSSGSIGSSTVLGSKITNGPNGGFSSDLGSLNEIQAPNTLWSFRVSTEVTRNIKIHI